MGPMIPLPPAPPGGGPAALPAVVAVNGAHGLVRQAHTNAGHIVNVWVAAPGQAPHHLYFCHGHSLATYAAHGYTVFSGPALRTVLEDEHQFVGSLNNAQAGDIVIWYNVYPGAGLAADYSALITFVGMVHRQVDPKNTFLSSKNGILPLTDRISLEDLIKIYGNKYVLYR
jgi:hypothetical protein